MIPFAGDMSYFDSLAKAADELTHEDNDIVADIYKCDPNAMASETNWMNWFDNVCKDHEYDLVACGNVT